jgi:hypothetical protein
MNPFNGLYSMWLWMKIGFKMVFYFERNISAQAQKSGDCTQAIWYSTSGALARPLWPQCLR